MSWMDEYNKAMGRSTKSASANTSSWMQEYRQTMAEYEEEKKKKEEAERLRKKLAEESKVKKESLTNEKEEEDDSLLDFFQAGALDDINLGSRFKDGWQFGDLTKTAGDTLLGVGKTILGTAGDAGLEVAKGAGNMLEGVADLATYGIAGVADLAGKDAFAAQARKGAQKNQIEAWTKGADDYLEKYSILGRTSDAVAQGIGQVGTILLTGGLGQAAGLGTAGVTALTTGSMGLSGMGSGMGEAYRGGATDEEAVLYGSIAGAADALSELMFGGLGKAVKATGLSVGLSSADDMLAKKVSSMFSSQLAKNLSSFGIKAAAEGFEEVVAGTAQALGKKLTYMSEEDFGSILSDENLLEQFVVGAIASGIAQAPSLHTATKSGTDFITGMTQNEEAVVKKEVEKRIADQERNGKKLTAKEKSAIEAQVEKDLDKGYISTDTIEEVLGGETYQRYKSTIDSENALKEKQKALQEEFDTLNKMKQGEMTGEQIDRRADLKEELAKVNESVLSAENHSAKNLLQQRLGKEVSEMVRSDRLIESYNEVERRKQAFQADLTKYDTKQRAVIEKAVKSGILNNTNRTHEFVDMVAKISADKGVLFDFTNNQKLKESGFAIDGKTVNGYVTKDGITLNIQSKKSLNSLVGHEITHVLEGTDLYTELQNTLIEYAKTKGDYQGRYDALTRLYEGVEGADINAELTADLVGDYLFTDENFINNLSTNHRNVFQKIYDEVKYLLKVATAGSKEARDLEKVKRAFEKAYQESTKVESDSDADTKYSLSDSEGRQLSNEQSEYFKDSVVRDENGNLKVMYHGTSKGGFNMFDTYGSNYGLFGTGSYFTDNKDIAESYTNKGKGNNKQVYETYLNIKNPMDMDAQADPAQWQKAFPDADFPESGTNEQFYRAVEEFYADQWMPKWEVAEEIQAGIESGMGYDGLTHIGGGRVNADGVHHRVYIAFQPEQIKNVDNVKPTDSADIRYSLSENATNEVLFSLSNDTAYMDKAISMNESMLHVDSNVMNDAKAVRERIAERMNAIKDRGLVGLPEDIEGNTYIANSSYDGTEENTTICPRSLAAEAFTDAVSEYLGRPLTVEEQIYISQDLQGRSLTPECTYCYVATDRKAYRAFLGEYIAQRDSVIQKVQANPDANVTRSGELYKEFLNGRKDTNPMYNRFKMWVDAYRNGKPMIEASHLANISKLMGDINSEFGAELKPQIVDAMKYAQSASWAKKRVNYVAYNGHILKWKQDRINKLNSHYGLRMYSFSDFHPAFVLENMQMITDASVRGLKMLGYTKDTDFVDIFAPTGMNINISTFGFEAGGEVFENNIIGAEWTKAKELRGQYPNVGITFVATNDTLVEWAMAQDWIDVVIPYHLVRTGAEVAKAFGYTNYTSESSDTKDSDWNKASDKKYIAPTEHNNDKATYLAALQKNHLKPRFERFLANPNYMKLVNECRQPASASKPVQPVFNEDAAMVALAKLEANGYYQPVGGSVERMYEIAAEVAESMTQQLGPTQRSLSDPDAENPAYGNYNVYGSDVALENAPVAENATTEDATVAVSKKETTTPSTVSETETVEDLFPDGVAPEVELENLYQQAEALGYRMREAFNADDTDALEQASTEYADAMERIETLEREINQNESSRMDSIAQSEEPPEMDAPFYGESEAPVMPDNPFEDRDYRDVGQRNVKAYMYENPEVKPFFQMEANAMLGYLGNSIRGERLFNDQVYYDSGGEKGWMGTKRMTTDDIAYLLDSGYTYADIEKGLNAIIEDNGAENNAVSKRIEFALNDRLMKGYTNIYGDQIPPDQDYLKLLREKEITAYSQEAFDAFMENADQYAPEEIGPTPEDFSAAKNITSAGQQTFLPAGKSRPNIGSDDIAPTYDVTGKKGVPDGQQAMWETDAQTDAIERKLARSKAVLQEEYLRRRAEMQAEIGSRDTFISNRARELYQELRGLRKGVKASDDLGYLLDYGYEWSAIRSALVNIQHTPDRTVNQNSVIENIAREMLNEKYQQRVYDLDDLESEYRSKVEALETEAEKTRSGEGAEPKLTRKQLHQNIVDRVKASFQAKGFDFDNVLKKAKDLSTFATVDNTPQRVMEKALGYKQGQVLSELTVDQVAKNETEGIKWLNSFTDRKKGLLAQISKQYNIKPGSKKSAAAQMYAEGFYVGENDEIIAYGDRELAMDFPNVKVQQQIKGLARDPRIRQIYDETLAAINESRTRNAYPEIPRLDNYFLHFRAMEDTFSRLGLPFNPNDIRAKDLPTDLNGVTADLKPGQPYFASAMHRTGKRTSFDLLGGLEKYLGSAKNQIYHIDDIQTLRAVRNYIAEMYGQATGLENLSELSDEEAQQRIEDVYGSHLSTFAKFLNEEANVLAGKTALIDRGLEGIIGRRGITFLNALNRQVGSNMVGYNISSSLTNFLAPVQAFAKSNKFDFVKGMAQTAANKVGSIFGHGDGFAEASPVMIRRKGAEAFYRTPWQKLADPGYVLMGAVDEISTELIARAKYNELTRKGMDSQQAHYETDKWVSRLMGDRSLGQQPQLYNSKMLGLVTKFQLEVRNQLDSQFYDTIQEAKVSTEEIQNGLLRNAKKAAKITSTFVQLSVLQHLFGKAFESVAGYNPAFDIISAIIKAFGWDDDEEDEDTVLDNIEEGFFELMGDMPYVSTLTGGRIPIESALPIEELYKGEDQYGNEKSRWKTLGEAAPYYLLPGGYGQIKKTMQGLDMFEEDLPIAGSYTNSGNLRFPVEDTTQNRVQAALFGQWASENARDYFDNEWKPLNEKQTQEFIDSDMPIRDYRDYREGLSDLSTLAEKADYIDSLDLPISTKNLLINNIADRKDPIDMTNYDEFGSFEEFDYAQKNPEKYDFLTEYGISYSQYKSFDDDAKEEIDNAYSWVKNNPEKVTFSRAVTDNVLEYRQYTSALNAIRADKDSSGKTINGSAKAKKVEYINSLDLDYGAKLVLFKSEYNADDTYNGEIIEYIISREDFSYEDKVAILKELGFEVSSDGTVTW